LAVGRGARLETLFTGLAVFPPDEDKHTGWTQESLHKERFAAVMLFVEHSNCVTAQNNHNPRFRTERARKGLNERGKKRMLIKCDASHIRETT